MADRLLTRRLLLDAFGRVGDLALVAEVFPDETLPAQKRALLVDLLGTPEPA